MRLYAFLFRACSLLAVERHVLRCMNIDETHAFNNTPTVGVPIVPGTCCWHRSWSGLRRVLSLWTHEQAATVVITDRRRFILTYVCIWVAIEYDERHMSLGVVWLHNMAQSQWRISFDHQTGFGAIYLEQRQKHLRQRAFIGILTLAMLASVAAELVI